MGQFVQRKNCPVCEKPVAMVCRRVALPPPSHDERRSNPAEHSNQLSPVSVQAPSLEAQGHRSNSFMVCSTRRFMWGMSV